LDPVSPSGWIESRQVFPFIKGRVALYAILRAAGIGPGDEVLVPGFTCYVVPAAVGYTGAKPLFYDIEPATYNGDPHQAAALITPATRAVIVQHTFGMPMDLGALPEICKQRKVILVEDCAHAMGAETPAGPVGTLGDAAFSSLQWSKLATTGLGGLAHVSNARLESKLSEVFRDEIREPGALKSYKLAILSSLYNRFFRPSWYWRIRGVYHWLSERNVLYGSSTSSEFTEPNMPANYRERFGAPRAGQLRRVLAELPLQLDHRKRIAGIYSDWCREKGLFMQKTPPGCRSAHLRFPLLVERRDELLAAAQAERIEIGDWMNAPLHPQEATERTFGYKRGMCSIAEAVAARVINLPTHRHIDEDETERILGFLVRHEDQIARHPIRLTSPSQL